MDELEHVPTVKNPPGAGPLSGLIILLVEDSNLASDAFRLMCLHSGARMRRVDSLCAARQHLKMYQPDVVIVDLGLPDGSGQVLIAELAVIGLENRRPLVVLGLSGDPDGRMRAQQAGALGFIAKPVTDIGQFQRLILSAMPGRQRRVPHMQGAGPISPDPLAYREDLQKAAEHLNRHHDIGYVAQFLGGVARSTQDTGLESAVHTLMAGHRWGHAPGVRVDRLGKLMKERLSRLPPL